MSSSRYEAEQETKERAHSNAVRELAEARHWAGEYIDETEIGGTPPYQTLINENPPTPGVVNGDTDWRPPVWADALRGLHAAILKFWTEVKPYRHRAGEDWSQPLQKIRYPQPGEWVTRYRSFNQEYRQRGVQYTDAAIALQELGRDWRFQSIPLSCEHNGEFTNRREKIHIPPVACRAIYEELNDFLDDLGLLAEVREIEGHATDPGVPDDIEAWGGAQSVQE